MTIDVKTIFDQLAGGRDLPRADARAVFERILAGELSEAVVGALLGALMAKGESVSELVGAAEAMRSSAVAIEAPEGSIDTCGTGGDGISTFNVSTTAAIIAASAGAIVAKHGNRSTTRASGSTEVLTRLGVDVDADQATVQRCIAENSIGYLNARALHPAMKFAAPIRQAIPVRTIFNLLGPLTNPAGVRRQVLGVPREELLDLIANALMELGSKHAWVVHGQGLCDLTATGETTVVEIRDGKKNRFVVTPEDAGLSRCALSDLCVDSPEHSAKVVLKVLSGTTGGPRDHALLNAGAALVVAGVASDLRSGVALASVAVDDESAMTTLERWRTLAPQRAESDQGSGDR